MELAILGGTGKEGSALVRRFAKAGVDVVIGSRSAARAQHKADELNALLDTQSITGASNRDATAQAEVVLLSIPYEGMTPILEDIREAAQGKVLINIASALDPQRKSRAKLPSAGSITAEIQQFFGENAKVVAAFQNVSPEHLEITHRQIDCDVLVCGADRATRERIIALIERIGVRAFDAGVLANAAAVESLTAVLIAINIKHKTHSAGIRITGVGAMADNQ
ncbi:MAG: NADPH-dependent F420 reductase [Chloroflexi bacterium]|nr:NADPH-dependent F420 reductase [Chloroflexota bacterium]